MNNNANNKPEKHLVITDELSMRDYFAAQAMAALVSREERVSFNQWELARDAYRLADAMLEVRGEVT
jgi:hypothetical protein